MDPNGVVHTAGRLTLKAAALGPQAGAGLARWRAMAPRPWVGIACFACEFVLWLAFFSLVPLSEGVRRHDGKRRWW